MEIELKFLVEESFTRDRILNDQHLLALADGESLQAITMKAIWIRKTGNFWKRKSRSAFVSRMNGWWQL